MEQGLTKMSDLPLLSETIKSKFIFSLPNSPLGYLNLPFFTFWVVGFSISEGSFLIKSNLNACFQLKQRTLTCPSARGLIYLRLLEYYLTPLEK